MIIQRLKSLYDRFLKSEYSRHVMILTSGTGLAQLIGIGTAPIMTRIYDPELYAILAVYMMITGLIGSVTTLQYQNVVVIAKDDDEAKDAIGISLFASAVISIVSLLVFLFLSSWVISLVNFPQIYKWLWFAPISIFFSGWNTAFSAWAIRQKEFKVLSLNRIISAVLVPVFSISLGLIFKNEVGLIVGLLVSQVIPALMLSRNFFRTNNVWSLFHKQRFLKTAKEHVNFPRYTLPSEFINSFVNNLPVFFITRYFGDFALGNFNLTNRILGMPVQLVAASVGEVYRQRASQDYNEKGNCLDIYKKTFKTLSLLSIVPFLILAFFGGDLFAFVFGEKWQLAGEYCSLLAVMYFFRFVANPLSYTYFIAKKTREDFWFHIIFSFVLAVVLFFVARTNNADYFILGFAIVYSLAYIASLIRTYSFSKGE